MWIGLHIFETLITFTLTEFKDQVRYEAYILRVRKIPEA